MAFPSTKVKISALRIWKPLEDNREVAARVLSCFFFLFAVVNNNFVSVSDFSVNKIRSLEDFQHCRNLMELFVRKNEIADLSQILYLQNLPKLKNLWLEENPCASEEE